jgi:hypothetical protein
MPRLRAIVAVLLAVTWCSAAWHCDLEAVGMMLEHRHHGDHDHDTDHAPVSSHDHHEQVFARDVAKDQVRVIPATITSLALVAFATWLVATAPPSVVAISPIRERRETDPPLAHIWQFVQRCAPESAAPPALG